MRLVIGGAYQGKLEFAISLLENENKRERIKGQYADGRTDSYEFSWECPVVYCFHEYIRRLLLEGGNPMDFSRELLEKNEDVIIVADEIGCGIVPVDPFERAYRDEDGRVCQYLGGEAKAVYRVVCGLGTRIKG